MSNRRKQIAVALALLVVCSLLAGTACADAIALDADEFSGILGEEEIFGCLLTEEADDLRILRYSWKANGHYRRDYNVTLDSKDEFVRMDVAIYDYDTGEMTGIYTFLSNGVGLYVQYKDGDMEFVVENNAGTCMVHFYENKEYVGTQDEELSSLKGYPNYFTQMTLDTYTMYDGSTGWGVFVDDGDGSKAIYMCTLSKDGSCSVIDSHADLILQYTNGDSYYVQDAVWYCYQDGHVEKK